MDRYPEEVLDEYEDDGTMPENVAALRNAVVGHRIVSAEQSDRGTFVLTLDSPDHGRIQKAPMREDRPDQGAPS